MAGSPLPVLAYLGQNIAYGGGAPWMKSELHHFKAFPFDFHLAKGTTDNFACLGDVPHAGSDYTVSRSLIDLRTIIPCNLR
jgi:hypothetical protein